MVMNPGMMPQQPYYHHQPQQQQQHHYVQKSPLRANHSSRTPTTTLARVHRSAAAVCT